MKIARILTFVAQSIVIGLAVAFLLMLLRPGLFKAAGPEPISFAAAVAAKIKLKNRVDTLRGRSHKTSV